MGCEYCKYWKGGEIEGVKTCSASQKFRDGFCGVGTQTKNSKFTPKKKKRKRNK